MSVLQLLHVCMHTYTLYVYIPARFVLASHSNGAELIGLLIT